MYSGGDSSGEGVNSHNQFNWQMTSQTSCNVNSGSIDWASLAQQWIQMKDSGAGLPETPPPPIISSANSIQSIQQPTTATFDEQGEADMEVEKDDEVQVFGFGHNTPPPPLSSSNPRWLPISNQQPNLETYCPPQQNWPWPARVALPPPILHVPITTGSLTPPIPKDLINSTTPPLQKPNMELSTILPGKGVMEQLPMDAAKRKILPAWIREGLEKMEREKLKQLERDTKEKDPLSAGTTAAVDESDINNFKTMVKSSIKEMEGESSGNEDATNNAEPFEDTDADSELAIPGNVSTNDLSENILNSGKTYEERIADMMIGVRKTLTELLLEVTNEEIVILANEAIRKRREKASSVQVIRKSAIPSITGKLGLEAYADSDSENSGSDNDTNDESKRSDDDHDSEEELKANIRMCQRAFLKTIEEIEDRIEATERRDELLLREHRKNENNLDATSPEPTMSPVQQKIKRFDKEIGEPLQPDKKSSSNGKRRKERTSRFSDNKDSRSRNMSASFYQPPTMGTGSLPSQVMPLAIPVIPPLNLPGGGEFKPRIGNSALATIPENEKRSGSSSTHKSSKQTSSSTSGHSRRRRSDSSTSSSDSSSSSTSTSHSRRSKYSNSRRSKRSSRERSKRSSHKSSHRSGSHRSSSHRSSRRRDSSDSNGDDHYSKRSSNHRQHKSHSSSKYSRKNDRRRSDSRSSRSRTRSRSRSRSTTYSSSRRGDRC